MTLYDINGNTISSDENISGFSEKEVLQNGLQLPAIPINWTSDTNWTYTGNSGNLATALGSTKYMYAKRIFTGRVYVRTTIPTPYSGKVVQMYLVDSDYISNPTDNAEKLSSTKTLTKFDGNYIAVTKDGEISESVSDTTDGYYGYVVLQQFDIPDGKCAVLITSAPGTNNGNNAYIENWFTVFTIDPSDNIVRIPKGDSLMKVLPDNLEGFGKGTAENEYFQQYLKEIADKVIPKYYRPHTYEKALYIAGDSLHAYAGGNGFDVGGFITDYNKYLGFKTVVNDGYAGQTMSGTGTGGGVQRAKALIEAGTPYDVFIFAYGTNDDTNGLGAVSDDASDTALTLVGGMKWIIENMRTVFPKSAIGFVILPPSSNKDQSEKRTLMIDVCEAENIPYIDMFLYVSKSDLSDGTHLGSGGMVKYCAAEAKLILDICPYGETLRV